MSTKRSSRKVVDGAVWSDLHWSVKKGDLRRGVGNPGRVGNLFRMVAEKLPYESLAAVRKYVDEALGHVMGVYIAHDSMGCPRYIGRGNIFDRLKARKKAQHHELRYFSFYVVEEKKHEREIETLLIRGSSFLLEFNDRKRRVGIQPGDIKDFEAGTKFLERQHKKGRRAQQPA
ncbi:hypothetical protein [Sorangium sp. So ce1099]|uniref:hypothetical protein n=1 Tax=Sorangium sp. So ce1099 TaxID=3133331 RepID=UPI003F62CD18